MKVVVILLAVGLLILGLLYFNETQTAKSTREQLAAVSNQVVTVKTEMTAVKKQMSDRVTELQSTLGTEKSRAQERISQLQERVATAEKDLQQEKNKLASVEDERTKVESQLNTVSNQLVAVRRRFADLARTHTGTEIELNALQDREERLEMERASLERQLNDLDALKSQIRLVKHRIWEQRIAEWKKRDADAAIGGNRGVLYRKSSS